VTDADLRRKGFRVITGGSGPPPAPPPAEPLLDAEEEALVRWTLLRFPGLPRWRAIRDLLAAGM
jgi:hypothetical protein